MDAGLRRTKAQRTKVRPPVDSIEDLIEQIHKHLNWSSEDPQADATRITKAVEEFRSSHVEARKTRRSSTEDGSAMLKKEIKRPARPRLERSALRELVDRVVDNPEAWLSTPNSQFGNREPRKLIGTKEEFKVINLLRAVDLGLF